MGRKPVRPAANAAHVGGYRNERGRDASQAPTNRRRARCAARRVGSLTREQADPVEAGAIEFDDVGAGTRRAEAHGLAGAEQRCRSPAYFQRAGMRPIPP